MLTSLSKNGLYRLGIGTLWFLVILGLPVTSFPLLANLTGAIVAPFSAIPLALLMLVWLIPYLLERGKFPIEILPYLYFLIIALIISALAFFMDGHYARGRDFFGQSLRAFITAIIGLSFYLSFSVFPQDEKRLRQTLVFISVMGMLLIPWTLYEVILLRKYSLVQGFPEWVIKIRGFLSAQSPNIMYTNRVTGFAYEPSWFVRIFNLVLFPIWLAAIFLRKSAFSLRLWVFQLEDLFMLLGLLVFGFTSPRIGLIAFLVSLAWLGLMLLKKINHKFRAWVLSKRKQPPKHMFWVNALFILVIFVILFGLSAGALSAYIGAASSWDNRFQMFLDLPNFNKLKLFPLTELKVLYLARDLAFFERLVYWIAGWEIFNDYPFGVGLGNSGFYFNERMPGAGLESFEVRNLVYRANYLGNSKNMYTRLLSETGFIGLAFFLVWIYLLWRSAGLSRKSASPTLQMVGLAGQLFILAYLFENLSMDSFAMPDQWVMTGLISAAGMAARREIRLRDKVPESASAQSAT